MAIVNQKFENHLDTIACEFQENLSGYEKVISIYHTDADGICSAMLIRQLLKILKLPFTQVSFNLDRPWEEFLHSLDLSSSQRMAVIFSDLGPDGDLLYKIAQNIPNIDFYLLDHHRFHTSATESLPNIYNANPTLFGLDPLKEIVGAALNYLFITAIDERLSKYAWIAVIGIFGDSLTRVDQMRAYHRQILEEAVCLEQVEIKEGLCLLGQEFGRLDRVISGSILPFLPRFFASRVEAKAWLEGLGIDPAQTLEDLAEEEIEKLDQNYPDQHLIGHYALLPPFQGLLRHPFAFAQLLSILGPEHSNEALQVLTTGKITREQKSQYMEYIEALSTNLSTFVSMQKTETQYGIFVDLTQVMPMSMWSDTGSFASINQLYDKLKLLFVGGQTPEGLYKISVRCTPQFMAEHADQGAVHAIRKFTAQYGGSGGGHGLAAGMRLTPNEYSLLQQHIDEIVSDL